MTSPQKQKGNTWERAVSMFLSKLYSASFNRIPNSGAYIGGNNAHRKQHLSENQIKSFKGDIVPPDDWIHFNLECKSYKDFPFHQVIQGSCKQLDTWLDQLMVVAEPNDVNLLCIKLNRKGTFIVLQSKYTWITDQFIYYTSPKHGDWVIMDFELFFQHNKTILYTYVTGGNSNETNSTQNTLMIDTLPSQ